MRPNDTVAELGAGVGYISSHLLKNLGARHVVAIEADPRLIPVIHRTHELNGVAAVVMNAVTGRANEMVPFNEKESFWASSIVALPGSRNVILPGEDIQAFVEDVKPDVIVADIRGREESSSTA